MVRRNCHSFLGVKRLINYYIKGSSTTHTHTLHKTQKEKVKKAWRKRKTTKQSKVCKYLILWKTRKNIIIWVNVLLIFSNKN